MIEAWKAVLIIWVIGCVYLMPQLMLLYFGENPDEEFRVRHLVYIIFWLIAFLVGFPLYWLWLGLGEFRKFLKRGW